jgi:hypothetical protein
MNPESRVSFIMSWLWMHRSWGDKHIPSTDRHKVSPHLEKAIIHDYKLLPFKKVVASPKSGPWWVLWVRGCPWLVLAPKVLQLCTNHLMLVLCKFMWAIEACQFFLVPSRNSSTPLYPSKVLRTREHASTFYSSDVFSLNS